MTQDIVFILGGGSQQDDFELRMALRAIEQHVLDVRRVWIIGKKPHWSTNVHHVPISDTKELTADGNIIRKMLRACKESELSENFIFASDDQLPLRPISVNEMLPFHDGKIEEKDPEWLNAREEWRERFKRTYLTLKGQGLSTYSYDTHIWTPYNKSDFPVIMGRYPHHDKPGFTINTLYLNNRDIIRYHIKSRKITLYRPKPKSRLLNAFARKTWIGYNDGGLTGDLMHLLMLLFPNKSKYETMALEKTPQVIISEWLDDPKRDYKKGLLMYIDYGANRTLKRYLGNKTNMDKLYYELAKLAMRDPERREVINVTQAVDAIRERNEGLMDQKTGRAIMSQEDLDGKIERLQVKRNPILDYKELPEDMQKLYDSNGEMYNKMRSLHASARSLSSDVQNNQRRKELMHEICELEDMCHTNWGTLDKWWAANKPGSASQPVKIEPPYYMYDPSQLDTLQMVKAIDAADNYIRRNDGKAMNDKARNKYDKARAFLVKVGKKK